MNWQARYNQWSQEVVRVDSDWYGICRGVHVAAVRRECIVASGDTLGV